MEIKDYMPWFVPITYSFIALILIIFYHTTFEEWDGVIQLFAGREIFQGYNYIGWPSHFWPPLYSFLIGFLRKCFTIIGMSDFCNGGTYIM